MKVRPWHRWLVVALNVAATAYAAVRDQWAAFGIFLALTVMWSWVAGFALGDRSDERTHP